MLFETGIILVQALIVFMVISVYIIEGKELNRVKDITSKLH